MALNIKRSKTTRWSSDQHHRSYGIQKWLVSKKFILSKETINKVDHEEYKKLLKEFCLFDKPDFNFTNCNGEKIEKYIQNRFSKFCTFVCTKFK